MMKEIIAVAPAKKVAVSSTVANSPFAKASGTAAPAAKKTTSYGAPKKTAAPAEEEMDPELAALLKKLDETPSAPAAPAPKKTSYGSAPAAPAAKKTTSYGSPTSYGAAKKTAPPAEEEMDPELAALLKKLDETPSAPPAPKKTAYGSPAAKKTTSYGSPTSYGAAKKTTVPVDDDVDPELAALLKQLDGPSGTTATATKSSYSGSSAASSGPKSYPSSVNKAKIIKDANERYVKKVYERFCQMGFLEHAGNAPMESCFFVDWDTIFSDPGFIKKYPDPTTILGYINDTRTTRGFMTSMECYENTMMDPCCSSDTPERNTLNSVKKFVITLDMSLPEHIEPTWTWNKSTKILTATHNPLSFIDGIQWCYYMIGGETHNGSSSNWWVGLWWVMNDGFLPYMPMSRGIKPLIDMEGLIPRSGYNTRDNPQLARSYDDDDDSSSYTSSRSSKSSSGGGGRKEGKCSSCNGTGNWGAAHKYKTCIKCKGKGVSKF